VKLKEKAAVKDWDAYIKAMRSATVVDDNESVADKYKRIARLKEDVVAFCKYYFPHHCKAEFSKHHVKFLKRIAKVDRLTISRAWHRGGAKSTVAMMGILYRVLSGRKENLILASKNETNATELLKPFRLELESNERILNDFDAQKNIGSWEDTKFVTKKGSSFRAIGMGQSPRGAKEQEVRPTIILCDDLDDDEVCRNPKRLDEAEDWMLGALFGCFDIAKGGLFIAVNNIIAKDCLIKRVAEKNVSDDHEVINVIEKAGDIDEEQIKQTEAILKSDIDEKLTKIYRQVLAWLRDGYRPSWHQHLSLFDIAYILTTIGTRRFEREYMNNPTSEGKVFKRAWIQWGKTMRLSAYNHLLINYLDPGFKKTKTSDTKALVLIGLCKGKYHIIKVFVDQASVNEMVEWCYAMDAYIKADGGVNKLIMEEVFLQDLLYKDFSATALEKGYPLPVRGDTRKKPDKDARIEATSGYFERGDVIFNEEEKESHHMRELIEQYMNFEPGVKTKKDGCDAVEGAIFILNQSITTNHRDTKTGNRPDNSKRV
jgi:phage terminase large subunit-like protein